ncbi:MAG: hypothetical protein ACLP4V_22325 [Methylocella sp.]
MDEETKRALDALKAEIAALKARHEPENTISLNAYAARIGFSRESARRRLLADPKLGAKVGGRWRVTP